MTLFVKLLDVPVDEKPDRLRAAMAGEAGNSTWRDLQDMAAVPGSAFVYWPRPVLLDLFRAESRWGDYESRCGLGTLDDFRFLRLWWEVPSADAGWVPFAKGGRFAPFHADIALKVNWHGGSELKASVERKVGSASRKVQGQEFYLREGLTWPRRPHVLGSFQVMPRGCIYSDNGPGLFSEDPGSLLPLCAVVNSSPFLYLLECLMPRGSEGGQTLVYEAGYITSVPVPTLPKDVSSRLAALTAEGWRLGHEKAACSETSLRFSGVAPPGTRDACDLGMNVVLEECDSLVAQVLSLDDAAMEDVNAWAGLRRSQASRATGADDAAAYRSAYLSWCVGCAFGRFRQAAVEVLGHDPYDALPQLPPAAGSNVGEGRNPVRDILVDDRGHGDDIVAAMSPFLSKDPEEVVQDDPETLRVWMAERFFSEHVATYTAYRRKAPIYWRLGTPSGSYSVWLYYQRLTLDTLFRVQSDYTRPKLLHERGNLDKLRSECGPSLTAAQRKAVEDQQRFVDELQAFDDDVGKAAAIWVPKLDDGVVVNFAPLWRLVGHDRVWQRELAATWNSIVEGKLDWASIALRLWPERVLAACSDDRSLAIAHGLEADLWQEGLPGKWTRRSSPRRPMADIVAQVSPPSARMALSDYLAATGPDVTTRRTRRRA